MRRAANLALFRGMRKLAFQHTLPASSCSSRRVAVKPSGLGTFIQRNDPAHIALVVGQAVAMFGARHCMFGSNFPTKKIRTDPTSLVQAHRDAVQHLPPADQAAICSGTATRVYRLADQVETFTYVRYAFDQHAVRG